MGIVQNKQSSPHFPHFPSPKQLRFRLAVDSWVDAIFYSKHWDLLTTGVGEMAGRPSAAGTRGLGNGRIHAGPLQLAAGDTRCSCLHPS